MKKSYSFAKSFILLLILFLVLYLNNYFSQPTFDTINEKPLTEFSPSRAMRLVEKISQKPHYVSSVNHDKVLQLIVAEMKKLGLQPTIQEGFTMTEKGTLVYSKNIIAKIPGTNNSKALLLLSHYDSAPHTFSKGAADDASGIATILEGIRTYRNGTNKNKNDIIILFTDAEEIGLNGAALFCTQHKWAKSIGLALNFEARGTAGNSYMLMETNNGNSVMVSHFGSAGVGYPASNSLMYSIYKMLPNDTDLTVFREKNKIQGFNFAFIDNHFNYHTEQDNAINLDRKSLAQQGSYLMPLLTHFAQADLSKLNSKTDSVYFNFSNLFCHYPNSWILPMIGIGLLLFLFFIFVGLAKRVLYVDKMIRGLILFLLAFLISGILGFGLWQLIKLIYPEYQDILQGFPYNGHWYVYAFLAMAMGVCFIIYHKDNEKNEGYSKMIFPLLFWFIICAVLAFYLQGASFLIIPVISSVLMLGFFVFFEKAIALINLILALPILFLLVPFLTMFPVGLGLKIVFASCMLLVMAFVLLLPILGSFANKRSWAILCFVVAIGLLVVAHLQSSFTTNSPKPNSLVYYHDGDTNQSYWVTYNKTLDSWIESKLGKNPKTATTLNTNKLYSKYQTEFSFMKKAPNIAIAKPTVVFEKDSVVGVQRFLKIVIYPNRKVNRYDIFNKNETELDDLVANGVKPLNIKSNIINANDSNKIISYYVENNMPLTLEFSVLATNDLDLELIESSFDLLSNKKLAVANRPEWAMSMPFVLNNAIIVKQKIAPAKPIQEATGLSEDVTQDAMAKPLDSIIDSPAIFKKPENSKGTKK